MAQDGSGGASDAQQPPDRASATVSAADLENELADATAARETALAARDRGVRDDEDRSWIGRRIITLYLTAIVAVFVVLGIAGLFHGDWPTIAGDATDVLKSGVVPIVTLVLGYYFGKADKS